jgi:hypothetical protein
MHHMKKTPPPLPNIRLTITVSPEVHQAFKRLSEARSMSISRTMGEWLDDTLDASLYLAEMVEKAREAPRLVAQQLHAYAHGLADESGKLLEQVMADSRTRQVHAKRAPAVPGGRSIPPSCNTGGKVPPKPGKGRGKP